MEFKSKPIVFMVFMMTQMLPAAVGFAPLYILMSRLGMIDKLITVIIILVGGQIPFGTILLIGFMKGIPKALEEAALIDGCGRIKTFSESLCRWRNPACSPYLFSCSWPAGTMCIPPFYILTQAAGRL